MKQLLRIFLALGTYFENLKQKLRKERMVEEIL